MAECLRRLLVLVAACCMPAAMAAASDDALDARVMALSAELRCLVCQNQSLADSHAPLAVDLRLQMREQLAAGRDEAQVQDWLVQRYGDYIHYRPPLDRRTWLLWAAPALLAVAGASVLVVQLRRRRKLDAAAFDPDDRGETDDGHAR